MSAFLCLPGISLEGEGGGMVSTCQAGKHAYEHANTYAREARDLADSFEQILKT